MFVLQRRPLHHMTDLLSLYSICPLPSVPPNLFTRSGDVEEYLTLVQSCLTSTELFSYMNVLGKISAKGLEVVDEGTHDNGILSDVQRFTEHSVTMLAAAQEYSRSAT